MGEPRESLADNSKPQALNAQQGGRHHGGRYLLQSLSRNASLRLLHYALTIAVGFVLSPFILHRIGKQDYGAWVFLAQTAAYLELMDIGLRTTVARFTAKAFATGDQAYLNRTVASGAVILAVLAAITMAGGFALAWWIPRHTELPASLWPTATAALAILALSGARGMVGSLFGGILNGGERFNLTTCSRILSLLVRATAILYFIGHGYGIIALALVTLVANTINDLSDLGFCLMLRQRLGLRWARPSLASARELLDYALPFAGVQLTYQINFKTDNVVLGFMFRPGLVAFYAVGGALIEYLHGLNMAVSGILMPMMTRFYARDERRQLAETFLLACYLWATFLWPVLIAMMVVGPAFVGIWMGPSFAVPSGQIIRILALGYIVAMPIMPGIQLVFGAARHRAVLVVEAVEAVLNVVLSIALAFRFGINGVALGTAIPMAASFGIFWPLFTCRIAQIRYSTFVRHALLPAAASAGAFALELRALTSLWPPNSYARISAVLLTAGLCYLPVVALITWMEQDRLLLRRWPGSMSAA